MACICPSVYTGLYCETPIDQCTQPPTPFAVDVCNGNGDCYYVSPGEYYCKVSKLIIIFIKPNDSLSFIKVSKL